MTAGSASRAAAGESGSQRVPIVWLNPAIGSPNLGDQIIEHAIDRELKRAAGSDQIMQLPTRRPLTKTELEALDQASLVVLGGTNIMTSNVRHYRQWKFGPMQLLKGSNVVLLGVGWSDYQDGIAAITRRVWRRLLDVSSLHSVRDEYSRSKLSSVIPGQHVLNTSCPTLWDLPVDVNLRGSALNAVVTVTHWRPDIKQDTRWLRDVEKKYDRVYAWPQDPSDRDYLATLGFTGEVLPGSLAAYDNLFSVYGDDLDYVGTRLHGGIRALQHGARSFLWHVDNRGIEIGKDVNLPGDQRGKYRAWSRWLDGNPGGPLVLPHARIEKFRASLPKRGG